MEQFLPSSTNHIWQQHDMMRKKRHKFYGRKAPVSTSESHQSAPLGAVRVVVDDIHTFGYTDLGSSLAKCT